MSVMPNRLRRFGVGLPCRGKVRSHIAQLLASVLFVFAIAAIARAGDSPPNAPINGGRAVALNQGVALDSPDNREQAESAGAVQQTAAGKPSAGVTEAASGQDAKRVGPAYAGPAKRTLTRTSRGFEGRTAPPWYASGFGALAIILAIIGGLAWAVRRWVPSARAPDSGLMRVLGRTAVTPRHSVALLHVGRRVVMVGLCGDRLNALGEITDADEVAQLLSRSGPVDQGRRGVFDEVLRGRATEFRSRSTGETEEREEHEQGVPPLSSAGAVPHREPLADLLRRLRTLQVK